MHIKVTDTHIAIGRRESPTNCPIALAIRSVLPAEDVSVGTYSATVDTVFYQLPSQAVQFITDFDASCAVEPFEFDL